MEGSKPQVAVWDNVAQGYDFKIGDSDQELAEEILEFCCSYLSGEQPLNFVELGSGSGHLSAIINQAGHEIDLVDFSTVALDKAKECIESLGGRAEYYCQDILELNLDKEYDIAWNSGVMEHFSEPSLKEAIKSIGTVNAKYYLILVPNERSLPYLIYRYNKMSTGTWIWGTEYLRSNYISLFEEQGFRLNQVKYFGKLFSHYLINSALQVSMPLKTLMNNKIVREEESFLVGFMFTKEQAYHSDIPLTESYIDETELKTQNFDLLAQLDLFRNVLKEKESLNNTKIDELNETIDELNETITKLQNEATARLQTIDELNKTIIKLHNENILLEQNTEKNESQISRYLGEIQQKQIENEKNQAKSEELQKEVDYYKNSRSWKITKPFRMISKAIRQQQELG